MTRIGLFAWIAMVPVWAGEMPEKAANYHAALAKRPESLTLFDRFRDAWLEERSAEDLEVELLARAEAGEAGSWAMLGRARLAAGKEEAALEAFGKAKAQAPAAWLDLEMAKLRLAAKDFAAAEKAALAVPEGDPRRPDALKLAGLACLRGERVEEALAHWAKAVAAAPGDKGLLEDLTELTRREGRFDLALEFCGKWRDATDDAYGKAMATLRRSELLLGSQRFDESMAELAAVLKVSADGSWLEREAIARAEQAHRQQGNTTGWAKWIGGQADENPTRLNFRRALAQALAASGKVDEALEVLAEVLKRSPGDLAARWQRVDFLVQSMKLNPAFDECKALAAEEKSEAAGLRLAELAFRLEKKDEVKRSLDGVLAAADPAKRVGLAGLYARYGLPEDSEKAWREAAEGEHGGQALRELAKHLRTAGRNRDAVEVWKKLGAREAAGDRIEAAQMLAAAGERDAARILLESGREKFSAEPGYEAARAELALMEEKADEARAIFLELARAAQRPDELAIASKGWLRAVAKAADPLEGLGETTADRCLRAAWLAASDKPLPAIQDGDELERTMRLTLLREYGKWKEVVAMMEATAGERGPLFLSELSEAKTAAGDLPGALAAARAWRERAPDQPGPWLREADILEKLGRQKDVTLLLRRASARFEDNEDVARRLFSVLQGSLDPREAMEWAWKRHDRSEDAAVRSTWLREILRVSKEREQLEDLQQRFEERARRDPASPGPLVALAELAKARGDSRAELDFLRRAAVNAPRDVAVISALATLEERSGETARALERFAGLARLAPGPDSARQLAQAKIRLGDIEGGMRDLQALAGESGINLRALEQSAGDLASRGYVEEATRMLAAVDPARRDARFYFVLGTLLEIDGREAEAVEAFVKVMAEPADPAENNQRAAYGFEVEVRTRQYMQFLQPSGGRDGRMPGTFSGMEVPDSLVIAKMQLKSRLARLAMQQGGGMWTQAAAVIPELAAATWEQWREAMDFARSGELSNGTTWWDFMQKHPGNPLGLELLVESGQFSQGKPEQVDALLKSDPPTRVQMSLRASSGWRPDTAGFLESIDDAAWRDPTIRRQALGMVARMFYMACLGDAKTPVPASECARSLAVLEKAGFEEPEAQTLELLGAWLALLNGNTDDFVKRINAQTAVPQDPPRRRSAVAEIGLPLDAFEHWRKTAGDKAAGDLIARIESPVLRCQFSRYLEPKEIMARVERELAALPKDAPVETRRGLVRLKWSLHGRTAMSAALRKEMQTISEDKSDPRMALEATLQLMYADRSGRESAGVDRLKIQALAQQLMASPDAGDQAYAAQLGGYLDRSQQQNRTPVATRWGTSAHFSYGGSGRQTMTSAALVALEDRNLALREAAKFLENAARVSGGQPESLRDEIKALTNAKLLEDAMALISLPADAGLVRRVSMLALLDACSKTDRARELLAEIAKMRPWETRWTVDLALRAPEDAETFALLDSVAEREDFDRILMSLLAPPDREIPALLKRLERLADWAPKAKGRRAWMGSTMVMLANGGRGGMQPLSEKTEPQLECFRRYVKLALEDRQLAELGFRVMFTASRVETPESITDAARQAMLSGAYTSDERTLVTASMQESVNLPVAPSALEHLVQMAAEKGDEAAFPPEFRKQLEPIDPDSATWLAKMLAAKSVAELPDISIDPTKVANWVKTARNEAAMQRAILLPGRDAWLTGVFREKQYQARFKSLQKVIGQSLSDAAKTKTLPDRVFALLEAAAGPRKNWNKKFQPFDSDAPALSQLPYAAAAILNTAAETDAAMLLAVLDVFRDARVPVSETNSAFSRLSKWWQMDMKQPDKTTLAERLGKKRDAAFQLGAWQWKGGSDGKNEVKNEFIWGLPQVLREIRMVQKDVTVIKNKPDASLPELLHAWLSTQDKTLQRRALLKAGPDLAKLPAEIHKAVITELTRNMGAEDMKGLPAAASAQLKERLDGERKQRIEAARRNFEEMKLIPAGFKNQGSQIGSMLGSVIADDETFVAEVLAAWRPVAEGDKSGKELATFAYGLISNARRDPKSMMTILRLLDSLWQGSPPPPKQNFNWGDPFQNIWGSLGSQILQNPELLHQVATLSPKVQAQFWLASLQSPDRNFGTDSKLVKSLREATKGGEITRAALEWHLQMSAMTRDNETKIDGALLLGFAKALKAAGSPTETIAAVVCRAYPALYRMENPAAMMAETPALLEGLKTFPDDTATQLFQGFQQFWEQAQRDHRKATGDQAETVLPPVHPAESVALLKFAFTRNLDSSRLYIHNPKMTSIVLATGDSDLLDLWIKFSGSSLTGDLALILELLKNDRIAEAVALAPPAGRNFTSSRPFSAGIESLVAKLRADPTPQAFGLMARLSMLYDASGAEAPAEKYADRKSRLTGEFERVRSGLSVADRAALCLALNLTSLAAREHVPALDEFASESAAREFRKMLLSRSTESAIANLFVPATCSRVHAGDLSGIVQLSAIVAAVPVDQRGRNMISERAAYLVHSCLVAHANRLDAKLPDASVQAILTYAKALAGNRTPVIQGLASYLVHLAAMDAASLEAGLKSCGLESVRPAFTPNPYGGPSADPAAVQAMLRVALLHPVSSEALLTSLGEPRLFNPGSNGILALLREPQLRARISPARFMQWYRDFWRGTPEDLEAVKLYAAERRGDFDEAQRLQLDALLQRLENPRQPMDPAFRDEMRRRQMEQMQMRHEEMMRQMRDR